MPKIDVQTSSFPKRLKLGSSVVLNPTWDDILWAALTIGRPNIHYVFQYGEPSLYEALFRISMVRMAIEQALPSISHTLRRTDAFNAMDPTEKGAVNYFLGMVFCKVFSSKKLDTPWLLHLDAFASQLSVKFRRGRSRPDLVGVDATGARWSVFECKGRASAPLPVDRTSAKNQARRVRSVDGKRCSLRVAAFTYYSGNTLRMVCDDPDEGEHGEDLRTGDEQWKAYFAPALGFFEGQSLLASAARRGVDVEIAIHPSILAVLREGHWLTAHRLCLKMRAELVETGYRADGLRLKAGRSWTEKLALE